MVLSAIEERIIFKGETHTFVLMFDTLKSGGDRVTISEQSTLGLTYSH